MRAARVLAALAFVAGPAPAQQILKDIHVGESVGALTFGRVGEVSGRLLFAIYDSNYPAEVGLWVTDGSEAGTGRLLVPGLLSTPAPGASTGAHCFFLAGGPCGVPSQLWRSDGTRPGTAVVADVGYAGELTAYRHGVCFVNPDSAGVELWWSDGTRAGTARVADLLPGPASSWPSDLVAVGHRVLFRASDANGARVLWETDATAAGTRAVTTTPVVALARLGDALAYVTRVGSDSVVRLYDPATGVHRDLLRMLTFPDAFRAFTATDSAIYFTLTSDSISAVVRLDLAGNRTTVHLGWFQFRSGLVPAGDAVFFTAADAGGWRVFASRGGPAVALVDADIGQFANPLGTTGVLGKRLIFSTGAGEHGATFVSDGTVAGTERISDLGRGTLLGVLGTDGVVALGSTGSSSLIRLAGDSHRVNRIAHWKPTHGVGSFGRMPSVGTGRALFVANDAAGAAVYSTDGTPEGTHAVARGDTAEFVIAQERGFFAFGTRLYSTDGTQAGSGWVTRQAFSQPTVAADRLFAVGHDAAAGTELWGSDGTLAGTVRVADIEPGPCGSQPGALTPAGNGRLIVFSARTTAYGSQIWTSDGTAAGTRMVTAPVLRDSSSLGAFAVLGPQTIFWASHPVLGEEPWTVPTARLGAHVVRSLSGRCPGGTIPMQVAGAPRLGDVSFAFVARPNPPGVGALLLGTTIVAQSYVGCMLRVGDVVAMVPGTVNGAGQLSVGVPVPNDPRVLGVTFTAQYQLSQGATLVSEALYCTIGL